MNIHNKMGGKKEWNQNKTQLGLKKDTQNTRDDGDRKKGIDFEKSKMSKNYVQKSESARKMANNSRDGGTRPNSRHSRSSVDNGRRLVVEHQNKMENDQNITNPHSVGGVVVVVVTFLSNLCRLLYRE